MTFGEKLKEARLKTGYSQEELSQRLSVSRSAVAKWETDKGMPDVANLKALAGLLDVSVDYLLDDENTLDLSVIREPVDLTGEKGLIKKAKAKDALVREKFSDYTVYPLSATKKLSKTEKLRDNAMMLFTAFLPGIGCFDSGTDIVNALENLNNTFYLAENDKKQFFIVVNDEFMEIRQIATRISGKKFEIGNYKLVKVQKPL
ncbi:MAG: helix-turn-helix domain-containing protein [Lachnospiraceae bacterium]|nr:helix-turn-helix domain-containing protein [Lachnospiraceae bacterium]